MEKIIKLYFIFFIISIFLQSCNTHKRFIKENFQLFNEYFNDIDTALISHFPDRIDYSTSYISAKKYSNRMNSFGSYYQLVTTDNAELLKYFKKLDKSSYSKVSPSDTCALIIPWFSPFKHSMKDIDKHQDGFDKSCVLFSLPIPNFSHVNVVLDYEGIRLSDKFVIYVLDAKPIRMFSSGNNDSYGLPEEWIYGYTKGIAFSDEDNILIYWVSLW